MKQGGQAIVEYLLLTAVVLGLFMFVMNRLQTDDYFFKKLISPLVQELKYNYKYGDALALGWDESDSGGPRKSIQISKPNDGQTFRMFIPKKN